MRIGLVTGARWSRLLVAGVFALAVGASPQLRAAEKQAAQQLSPEVSKLLHDAQDLQKKGGDWDKMAELSRDAYAKSKTPYEQETSLKFLLSAGINKKDVAIEKEAIEKLVELPGTSDDDKRKFYPFLAQPYLQSKDYAAATPLVEKWAAAGGGAEAERVLAQLYLAQKQCDKVAATINKTQNGAPLTEEQLRMQYQCAAQTDNKADQRKIVAEYIARYQNRDFTMAAVAFSAQKPSDERALLNALRYAYDKDYLESANQYNSYADLAKDAGAVEEAEAVLKRGVSRGLVAGDPKVNKQLAEIQRLSAEDQKSLSQLDKEARAGTNGQADFAVGVAYFGLGQYAKAAEAIQRGLQPDRVGKIKRVDDAWMVLGISLLKQGKTDEAKKAFDNVHGNDMMNAVAKAWLAPAQGAAAGTTGTPPAGSAASTPPPSGGNSKP
jgi:hypothetical protein